MDTVIPASKIANQNAGEVVNSQGKPGEINRNSGCFEEREG